MVVLNELPEHWRESAGLQPRNARVIVLRAVSLIRGGGGGAAPVSPRQWVVVTVKEAVAFVTDSGFAPLNTSDPLIVIPLM